MLVRLLATDRGKVYISVGMHVSDVNVDRGTCEKFRGKGHLYMRVRKPVRSITRDIFSRFKEKRGNQDLLNK